MNEAPLYSGARRENWYELSKLFSLLHAKTKLPFVAFFIGVAREVLYKIGACPGGGDGYAHA
jgi:hypothetical protein